MMKVVFQQYYTHPLTLLQPPDLHKLFQFPFFSHAVANSLPYSVVSLKLVAMFKNKV